MRQIATIALMFIAAQTASSARGEPPDVAGSQPLSNFSGDRPAASTEELKKKVEQGGFKDVEVVPRMFVVLARKPDGQGVSLIVDADTLQALQLGADDSGPGGGDPAQGGSCQGPSGE